MPKCPRLDVKNAGRRIVKNLGKRTIAQESRRNANILEIPISHYLRDESHSIIKPFLRLASPEDLARDRKQFVPQVGWAEAVGLLLLPLVQW